VLVNAIVCKVAGECTDGGVRGHPEERDREQQAEEHSPEHPTQGAISSQMVKLPRSGVFGSQRPGDDSPIFNLDQVPLLELVQSTEHILSSLGPWELED